MRTEKRNVKICDKKARPPQWAECGASRCRIFLWEEKTKREMRTRNGSNNKNSITHQGGINMSSKTQKVVRRFVHTDPEWYPDVIETKEGYTVICARKKRGLKEYGCTLSTFKQKKPPIQPLKPETKCWHLHTPNYT